MNPLQLTILGQPCSKANSRQIVVIGGRPKVIKSKAALEYERSALLQIPPRVRLMLEGPVAVTLRLYYATELPDLDESIVLDVLQARHRTVNGRRELVQRGCYVNDRQVREKHVFHGIDRLNPRAEIEIRPMLPQQATLLQEDTCATK